MAEETSTIQIQDDDSQIKVSVVQTTTDITKNGVVVCNPDGSAI